MNFRVSGVIRNQCSCHKHVIGLVDYTRLKIQEMLHGARRNKNREFYSGPSLWWRRANANGTRFLITDGWWNELLSGKQTHVISLSLFLSWVFDFWEWLVEFYQHPRGEKHINQRWTGRGWGRNFLGHKNKNKEKNTTGCVARREWCGAVAREHAASWVLSPGDLVTQSPWTPRGSAARDSRNVVPWQCAYPRHVWLLCAMHGPFNNNS